MRIGRWIESDPQCAHCVSSLQISASRGSALRKAAAEHRRARVHITVHDWAGNKRIYDRTVQLSL